MKSRYVRNNYGRETQDGVAIHPTPATFGHLTTYSYWPAGLTDSPEGLSDRATLPSSRMQNGSKLAFQHFRSSATSNLEGLRCGKG